MPRVVYVFEKYKETKLNMSKVFHRNIANRLLENIEFAANEILRFLVEDSFSLWKKD